MRESRVIQNSLWIGIQPLILNVISIFATAYIVRGISQDDYGRFIFAFSLVTLLTPLCALGVRSVLVREMAGNLDRAPALMGRVLSLRLLLALGAYGVAVVTVNLLNVPQFTKILTYMACSTLLFNTLANSMIDGFQGYERMKFIAYGNLISGAILTLTSVLAIMFGFGVVGLTLAYIIGPITLATVMCLFHTKKLPRVRLQVDRAVWSDMLKKGVPFFAVGMVWMLTSRVGIIMLSKVSGDDSVAIYGAASGLVERLSIVPDSISTAMFPAISALFARNAIGQINSVLRKAFEYMVIFGVAVAVGLSLLSGQIMALIYGADYAKGGIVLSVIAWYVPFWFVMVLVIYCLGAVRMQGKVFVSICVATVIGLACNVVLIPKLGPTGLAVAYLVFYMIYCFLGLLLVRRHLGFSIKWSMLLRIAVANVALAGAVLVCRPYNLLLAIVVPALIYIAALLATRAVTRDDLNRVRNAVLKPPIDAAGDLGDGFVDD